VADGGSGIAGDWARLAMMRQRLGDVAGGAFRRDLLVDLAEEAARQIGVSFDTATDPYGAAWKARRKLGDGHPLLQDTGRLRASLRVRPSASGLTVTSRLDYAAAHQYGATLPERHYANAHGRTGRFKAQGRARNPFSARGARTITLGTIGATQIPARPFLPDEARGLGRWEPAFDRIAAHKLRVHFGL